MDVISLGFPEQTIPKWLNGYVYEWVQDGLLRCHICEVLMEEHNPYTTKAVMDSYSGYCRHFTSSLQTNLSKKMPCLA